MTEAQLQSAVIELAHVLNWRVAHFRPAMVGKRWMTPVAADGAGFPDLVLARANVVAFVELKSTKGKPTPEQVAWLGALDGVNPAFVWRPIDWTDGSIEAWLRSPTSGHEPERWWTW